MTGEHAGPFQAFGPPTGKSRRRGLNSAKGLGGFALGGGPGRAPFGANGGAAAGVAAYFAGSGGARDKPLKRHGPEQPEHQQKCGTTAHDGILRSRLEEFKDNWRQRFVAKGRKIDSPYFYKLGSLIASG